MADITIDCSAIIIEKLRKVEGLPYEKVLGDMDIENLTELAKEVYEKINSTVRISGNFLVDYPNIGIMEQWHCKQ